MQDVEERYRKRYLDLMMNPESRDRFNKRSAILAEIRNFLHARGFIEVETPMMQAQAGGAAAKPFYTHHNALDTEMVMRIAPELYLKRLIVGGFDKIFELGKNFRNEGIDRTHNPEFTVLEVYEAYGDRTSMKAIIEGLLPHLCEKVLGRLTVEYGEAKEILDFTPPYREIAYKDAVKEMMADLGRPNDSLYEVALWEDMLKVEGDELFYAYMVDNQAIVIPETIDAIRALTEAERDGSASIARTNAALGVGTFAAT